MSVYRTKPSTQVGSRNGRRMYIRSTIIISGVIMFAAASTAFSRDVDVPKIDVQTLCRTRQATVDAVFTAQNSNALELCVSSEQDARDKLLARWATLSTLDKTSCVHPKAYSPSYLEWLGCIDTREYVHTLQISRPASAPTQGPCPTVKWQPDGSIVSVETCNLY
jgi:hypothetical protein